MSAADRKLSRSVPVPNHVLFQRPTQFHRTKPDPWRFPPSQPEKPLPHVLNLIVGFMMLTSECVRMSLAERLSSGCARGGRQTAPDEASRKARSISRSLATNALGDIVDDPTDPTQFVPLGGVTV